MQQFIQRRYMAGIALGLEERPFTETGRLLAAVGDRDVQQRSTMYSGMLQSEKYSYLYSVCVVALREHELL